MLHILIKMYFSDRFRASLEGFKMMLRVHGGRETNVEWCYKMEFEDTLESGNVGTVTETATLFVSWYTDDYPCLQK